MIKLNLHVLLAQYRISQKELSDMTGIRQATISAYCSNTFKHIVTAHLDKICYVLNCTPHDVISYNKTKPEDIDEDKLNTIRSNIKNNGDKYILRADTNQFEKLNLIEEPIFHCSKDNCEEEPDEMEKVKKYILEKLNSNIEQTIYSYIKDNPSNAYENLKKYIDDNK